MAWIQGRIDRLRKIVAILIKEGVTPNDVNYGQRVYEIACGELGLRKATSREYAQTLQVSWRHYRWTNWVRGNNYLSEKERQEWTEKYSKIEL